MSTLTKMNEMAIQQLTGYTSAYSGESIEDLIISMGMDFEEWNTVKPQVFDWLPKKLTDEIDQYFKELVDNSSVEETESCRQQ